MAIYWLYTLSPFCFNFQANFIFTGSAGPNGRITARLMPALVWYATDLPEGEKSVTIYTPPATYC